MKTKFFAIFFAIFFISSFCYSQNINSNDLLTLNIKGKVKWIHDSTYFFSDTTSIVISGEKEERNIIVEFAIFDTNGNLMSKKWFDKNNKVWESHTYKYNIKERLIEEDWTESYGRLKKQKTCKYDTVKNRIIEENWYCPPGYLSRKSVFYYDSKGNRTGEKWYDDSGALFKTSVIKFDSEGNRVEENFYDPDGKLIEKYTYKYDSKNNMIEYARFNSDGSSDHIYKYTYEFDDQNNWIRRNKYENDAQTFISERKIEYY
jgi:hypothetical protein